MRMSKVKVKDLAVELYYEIKNISWDILEEAGIWDIECSSKVEAVEKVEAFLELWRMAHIDTALYICKNYKITLEDDE